MSSKLIIDNRTERPMEDVLGFVASVLLKGRTISGSFTRFTPFVSGISVFSVLNKKSDRLIITGKVTTLRSRLIIDNRTDRPTEDLLGYIGAILLMGRVSNEGRSLCYHSAWSNGINVSAILNEKSDRLVIYYEEPQE